MADFSKAVKLSSLKVGDSTAGYDNPNLTDLTIGNLVLLRSLDVRNCSALTQAVDISGCTNIEHVYFDGTATTGVTLPNGGILKTLHLPSTVTNLTILNQKQITDFVLPSYANVSTLRIENTPIVDTLAALNAIAANSRVRLVGVDWSFETPTEVLTLMDKLDTFRGLDEAGNNLDKAVVSGVIHIPALTREQLDEMNRRYPNITIDYAAITVRVAFYNGEVLVSEAYLGSGSTITKPADPTKDSTAQYNYTFAGWSLDGVNIVDVTVAGEGNMVFYAVYTEALRYYTIRFLNGTKVEQAGLWAYGDTPEYLGSTPVDPSGEGLPFVGWKPAIVAVTGDADYVAKFAVIYARAILDRTIEGDYTNETVETVGKNAFYKCSDLTGVDFPNATSIGYGAFTLCSALTSVNLPKATTFGEAVFNSCSSLTSLDLPSANNVPSLLCNKITSARLQSATSLTGTFSSCSVLTSVYIPLVTNLGKRTFYQCSSLASLDLPLVTTIGEDAFYRCTALTSVNLLNTTKIDGYAFAGCSALVSVKLPATPPSVSGTAFNDINSACVFYIPTGSLSAYQANYNWKSIMSKYTFEEEDRT
jgi:hypothetical protein